MDVGSRGIRYALLALVLAWVAVVTFHPHVNPVTGTRDMMPIHADEYVHWGYASAIAEQRTLSFRDPFSAEPTYHEPQGHEEGFQLYLALFHEATGLAWQDMIVYGPSLVAVLTALIFFVVGERANAGLSAALWFSAVPTSLRFLGPGWSVPIAFALPFLAFGLLLLSEKDLGRTLLPLAVVAAALWTVHVMAALTLTLLVVVAALALLRRRPAYALALIAALAVPLLLAHRQLEALVAAGAHAPTLPLAPEVLRLPGVVFYVAAALGTFALVSSPHAHLRRLGLASGVVTLLMGGVVVYRASTGIDPFRAYDRATLMLAFLCVLPAGVAVATAARWAWDAATRARLRPVGIVAVAILVLGQGVGVAHAARSQAEQTYYVSVTPEQAEAFEEAKAQLQPYHRRAIIGSGPTMPFSLLTGVPTVWVRTPESEAEPEFVREFFASGASDTRLLIELRASVVVTDGTVQNPDLRPIAPGVYVLRDDYAQRLPP